GGTGYFSIAQRATASSFAVIHADDDPLAALAPVRAAVHALDPAPPIYDVRRLDERLERSLGRRLAATWLVGVFAALALALAVVGTYGVIAYDVAERGRQIGIRMALGADRRAIVRLVMGSGMRTAAAGLAVGTIVAVAAARLAGLRIADCGPQSPQSTPRNPHYSRISVR